MKILQVKGTDYVVHYSINSLIEMENATGKPFTAIFDGEEGVSLSSLRTIIYYGLKSKQFDMTLEKAGFVMDSLVEEGKSIMEVSAMFISELSKALGMKNSEEPNPNE